MRALSLLTIAASLSCATRAPVPSATHGALPIPSVTTTTTASATASTVAPPMDLARLLCGDRSPCAVRRERPVGSGLRVVSVDLGVRDFNDDDASPKPEPPGDDVTSTATEDTIGRFPDYAKCRQLEYWLVGDVTSASPKQLLDRVCNDGHGAAGIGEASVEVTDGRIVIASSGGSSWRWGGSTEIGVAPLRVLRSSWDGYWSVGANVQEGSFDWTTFTGKASWFSPACDANGLPPQNVPTDPTSFEYLLVPAVAIDDDYRRGGWKSASLGACALDLDGTGDHGYVLHGSKGKRDDASMRVVAAQKGKLYVEVHDATPTGASARWVVDDHLEIWIDGTSPSHWDQCRDTTTTPRQWGVRIADGAVFAGFGAPNVRDLGVARAPSGDAVRFEIDLPPNAAAFTIAYSDGAGGKQKRLFASSPVKRDAPETLGAFHVVNENRAVCRVRNGRLEPAPVAPTDPDAPFVE